MSAPSPSATIPRNLHLLSLPPELRAHIFSYLLPDVPTIAYDTDYSPTSNSLPGNFPPPNHCAHTSPSERTLRSDCDPDPYQPCHTAIMRTCSLLHADGLDYLYPLKAYRIHVFDFGIDFLDTAGGLRCLPPVPYALMKEFVIEVVGTELGEGGMRLREHLVWLCGLVKHQGIRVRKLRIVFVRNSYWERAWDDEKTSADPARPKIDEQADNECNADLAAWENGFSSTFEYMVSAFALLHDVADECTIEVPGPLRGKGHVLELARWYEEGIDGRYPFPESRIMEIDKADFEWILRHPDRGICQDRECEDCGDCLKAIDRRNAEEIERTRAAKVALTASLPAGCEWPPMGKELRFEDW